MSGSRRISAGVRASTLSFFREPLNVALLLILPALSIQIYGVSLAQFPELGLFDTTRPLEITGRITGAVFATGALAGVLGLFQMISARNADRRLSICGFRSSELVGSRFATVLVVSIVISAVAAVTLGILLSTPIGAPVVAFAGLVLAGVVYGLLGLLVGTVLPRELEGSLVLVVLADVDNVFASGLFDIDESITRFAPLSHPHEIVTQAVVDGTLATDHVLPALAHVLVFALLGVGVYSFTVANGGEA
ncbi:ABC transporter permease [Halomicrococcus sp. SG-WS-1]|uniref:ABC transporter permease n=1 Tax=Halomicrococcus sp. SG-WS-1 TaxID=3439057 RepID=UPI003F7ABD79